MSKPRTPRHFPKMKHRAAKRRAARISIYDADMRMTASTHTRFRPHVEKLNARVLTISTTYRADGVAETTVTRKLDIPKGSPFWVAPVGTPFPEPGADPAAEGWHVLGHAGPARLRPLHDLVGDALADADDAEAGQ